MDWIASSQVLLAMTVEHNRKRAEKPRALGSPTMRAAYAACLCIAPDADAWPRIALTERSIAAHSRPISDAARPSA
jgi:hypothetical protein